MPRPNLFVVGAPKCGTSSLHAYLAQHPQIFGCVPKEPHYFGSDHRRINHQPRTEAEYLALFEGAEGKKYVCDSSTSYLHSMTAATEIKDFSPEAKIIIMLRNPVDVMYAFHATHLRAGFEFLPDFEAALEAEEIREHGEMLPRNRPGILEGLCYRSVARFTGQVRRYFEAFGRERVHVIVFDDFKRHTLESFRETLRFLGVDVNVEPTLETLNANRVARSVKLNNFLWNPPEPLQVAVQTMLPTRVRVAVVEGLKQANVTEQARPPMEPTLRRKLNEEFAPEVRELSDLLGRDLTHWSNQ